MSLRAENPGSADCAPSKGALLAEGALLGRERDEESVSCWSVVISPG